MDTLKYLEDLERRAELGGGEARLKKQHEAGKLTARERIDLLFDPGSFQEIDKLVTHTCRDFGMDEQVIPGDGVVAGQGRVDGRPVLLEAPRFPPDFDHDSLPVFNTNTGLIELDVLERDHPLTWLYVEKEVEARTAVQLERVYHELSAFVPTTFLRVPRRGPRGRFYPIKVPSDLERSRDEVRQLLAAPPM